MIWAPAGALADSEPLPKPILKDVQRAAAKIQNGVDWLYFEVKPALKAQNLMQARSALGSAMQGSFVSPLETDLMFPLQQITSANLDSEEDGWLGAFRQVRAGIDDMKEHVG